VSTTHFCVFDCSIWRVAVVDRAREYVVGGTLGLAEAAVAIGVAGITACGDRVYTVSVGGADFRQIA
jgi:hypothetical protein